MRLSSLLLLDHCALLDFLRLGISEQGLLGIEVGEWGWEEFECFVFGGLSYDVELEMVSVQQDIMGVFSLKRFSSFRS